MIALAIVSVGWVDYAIVLGALFWLVYAWHRASLIRKFVPPTDYGPVWARRRRYYWTHLGAHYCEVCGWHPGRFRRNARALVVHHRYGAGNHWQLGYEPNHALLGVCARAGKGKPGHCHERIHRKHRRLIRLGLDREPYRRLDNVTRRAYWLGCWRRVLRRRPT